MENWKSKGKIQKESFGYKQYFIPDDCRTVDLPSDIIKAFEKTASAQRHNEGCAEDAMNDLQSLMGGGVYPNMAEHIGDLTHRCTHFAKFGDLLATYVEEKVSRANRSLFSGYGFEKEHEENMLRNAECTNASPDEFKAPIYKAMKVYAEAHKQIPVFNEVQYQCREAAIALGENDFDRARESIAWLNEKISNLDAFTTQSSIVYRDNAGLILDYEELRPQVMHDKKLAKDNIISDLCAEFKL